MTTRQLDKMARAVVRYDAQPAATHCGDSAAHRKYAASMREEWRAMDDAAHAERMIDLDRRFQATEDRLDAEVSARIAARRAAEVAA